MKARDKWSAGSAPSGASRGQKWKKGIQRLIKMAAAALFVALLLLVGVNAYMLWKTQRYILSKDQIAAEAEKGGFDYILVLGAGVRPGGEPSRMLRERIDKSVELYRLLSGTPLLMSGDSVDIYYRETVVMAAEAEKAGVPAEGIRQDAYGVSTYDSIWRLRKVYQGKKVLIVTQKYHLSRSLFLARALSMEAYGADAQKVRYYGQLYRDLREMAARLKDFFLAFWQPAAEYAAGDSE